MTKEEVVAKLKSLNVPFRLVFQGGAIRTRNGDRCPIIVIAESLTSKTYDNSEWAAAAKAVGIEYGDACEIVGAADYAFGSESDLRSQLLSLCETK